MNKNTFHLNISTAATLEPDKVSSWRREEDVRTPRQRECKTRVARKRPRKDGGLMLESEQLPAQLAPQRNVGEGI